MKNKKLNEWYVVRIDDNVKCKNFNELIKRFSSMNEIGYNNWFRCWKLMSLYEFYNNDVNVRYCVMKLEDMWWLKRFLS